MDPYHQPTLAWHETLELHELVAFQSIGLMKTKMGLKEIQDQSLKNIYMRTIQELEMNLKELLQFYPYAPHPGPSNEYRVADSFLAGDLLSFAKAAVRNYGVAITETATPALRQILKKQLNQAIDSHERIYRYMYKNGLYPSYDLNKLLQHDIVLAKNALSM
ncbi:spore coat protein [Bacillus thermotolerans]|uniref:Spore coat protein F n=1 Tax=Bacillus thermotolerans TaxID=1221996 RepID=A0A0F5HJH4_BACTR|nr:spore coat protein [Bacillus thermotolerans]KKB33471.1 Spore coat protein F [Bacillus thermotolerans]KKB34365.1 Spore coat protein F [Bacillus thermotolerans]KKB41090.1 Spore coat protein F [Bacillus thermotolerans]